MRVCKPNSINSSSDSKKQSLDASTRLESQQASTPVLQAKLSSVRLEKTSFSSQLADSLKAQKHYLQQVQALTQQLTQIKHSAEHKLSQVSCFIPIACSIALCHSLLAHPVQLTSR